MGSRNSWLLFSCLAVLFTFKEVVVRAEPMKITRLTFKNCTPPKSGNETLGCCVPQQNLNGPIIDFIPKYDRSKPLRIKKALQCLSGKELRTYTMKLQQGYKLLRALPYDDPRSLTHQNAFHCAYGTGSLSQVSTNLTIDIHFSWFFYPWHRYFLYFHERILQTVLGDPDFTLHFWNHDNSITVSPPPRSRRGCFNTGHFVPPMYNDPTKSTYSNRSERAYNPTAIMDLGIPPPYPNPDYIPLPANETIARNRAKMHASMITEGNTSRAFLGRNYRAGDPQVLDGRLGTGTYELVHASPHFWIGNGMFPVTTSAFDPIFYAHHSNVDRLWTIWPRLGPNRHYPADNSDWMDAEFLFWDENKILRRVKVKDSLRTEAFGFRYEEVNDASWIFYQD